MSSNYVVLHHQDLKQKSRFLRHNMTTPEQLLWKFLRNKQLGAIVHRQYPINTYIVDFYIPKAKLVIELDGETHGEQNQRGYDEIRTKNLNHWEYKVLRFLNNDVMTNLSCVIWTIQQEINKGGSIPSPSQGDG